MSANGTTPTSQRKNHGRGHSYWIDGEKVPGVTTVLGDGYPKAALVDWAANETAGYAVDNWDELGELPPSKRLEKLKRARWDVSRAAAVRGTTVHEFAQKLAAGEEVEPSEELIGHVDSYLAFVRDWAPVELLVEAPIFSRKWKYAGTPDLIAVLRDGKTWLLDWKTTGKGVYLEAVLQLAALRYGEYTIDEATGEELALPKIDATGIVWVRSDGYDLVPVDADEHAHRVFLYVRQLREFVKDERENWIGDALRPPAVASA